MNQNKGKNNRRNSRPSRKDKQDNGQGRQIQEKFHEDRNSPKPLLPRNENQQAYMSALLSSQIVIVTGPAGVGKTFLAASMAADDLRKGVIDKIIVSRPYVQTGKSSGHLPGTILEKMMPYVRPTLDAIKKRLGGEIYQNALKDGQSHQIEVQPLESIRGRSFDEKGVLIIDEAQQSTPDEMMSIVTRISDDCTLVLCGDVHQKDIHGTSGLEWFKSFAHRHNLDVTHIHFTSDDIIRGGIVKDIVKGLEKDDYKLL